jgi:uncharacterized protein YbjT (DUF2867 family)
MVESKELVTITGATGFLGSTILKQFIEEGKYRIRATVRKIDAAKLEKLRVNMEVS